MSSERYEVIVVGAGPGGTAAALALARAGVRTALVEKAVLPRHKTCGGGVTHKAAEALPVSLAPVIERTLYNVDYSWRMGQPYVVRSRTPLVYMVQRSRFDYYLAEQAARAGADLRDGTAVTAVESDGHGATVQTAHGALHSGYVIGADGATGRVARSVGLMGDRWALPAVESEVAVEPATMAYWRDKIGLDLGTVPAAYGWVFPKADHLNIGVVGAPLGEDFGSRLKAYDARHTAAGVPGITRVIRSRGYLLPCRRPGAPVQQGRVLLVGDAAGLVEAFSGEGIYWAIRSGQLAAQAIIQEDVPGYSPALDTLLMPNLLSARHWWGLYKLCPYLCYALPRHLPVFWNIVCQVVRGERHYTDIRRRLGPLGFVENWLPDPLLQLA